MQDHTAAKTIGPTERHDPPRRRTLRFTRCPLSHHALNGVQTIWTCREDPVKIMALRALNAKPPMWSAIYGPHGCLNCVPE